jgi:hypothetical protein
MSKPPLPAGLAPKDTPERKEQLRDVIRLLPGAEFPRDYIEFEQFADALREETAVGKRIQSRWRNHVFQKGAIPGFSNSLFVCPTAIFLPLLQADLASATVHYWKDLTAGLRSPKREQAENEPVPAKAAALRAAARLDEEQALLTLRDRSSGEAGARALAEAFEKGELHITRIRNPKKRLKFAQRRRELKPDRPPKICAWSQPMSQVDYRDATGLSLKTIQRFLSRIKAHPKIRGRHAAVSDRYDVNVNLKILAHWIGSWVGDSEHAAGLAAATMAYANAHDRLFREKVIHALFPVLKRRKLLSRTKVGT